MVSLERVKKAHVSLQGSRRTPLTRASFVAQQDDVLKPSSSITSSDLLL